MPHGARLEEGNLELMVMEQTQVRGGEVTHALISSPLNH